MKRKFLLLILPSLLTANCPAFAYKETTHEDLSEVAAFASVLGKPELLTALGLSGSIVDPKLTFPNSNGVPKTIRLLIRDGASFEDALIPPRSLHHFYNPLNGSGLVMGFGLIKGEPSPDWALEDKGVVISDQFFSYKHAREYFYSALTGKTSPGGASLAPQTSERNRYFGLTFQSLGHVIHHIQDMAQPQHVRNDVHLDIPGTGDSWIPSLPFESPSLYESWTNDIKGIEGKFPTDFAQIGYDISAPKYIATFNQPRKFWVTAAKEGLAQFTNRNFVSAGTNYGTDMFNSPAHTISWRTDKKIEELCANAVPECPNLEGWVTFYGNWVDDQFTGEAKPNDRTSTLSLFDADLEKINAKKTFTLNRFNFEAAHRFLIPRAVAYSAGLINYFFRGRMEFKADPNNPGKYIIKNLGAEDMKGTFTLYYDAKDGKRYPVAGDSDKETWLKRSIAAKGELTNLGFTPPLEPAPKSPGAYMLVFNGDMGEEEAISGSTVGAVAATRVQPPSRIAFLRLADPYINSSSYDIFVIDPDGRNERNLTKSSARYNDLAWSPDGTRLAFSSNRDGVDEIYVLDVDTGTIRNVSNTPGYDSWPTWSPNGNKIAFQSQVLMDDGLSNSEILVASADGGELTNVTNTTEDVEWMPKWSPDGKSILIDSRINDLWGFALLNIENGSRRQLTVSPYPYKHDYNPDWSPDGKKIAFSSDREDYYDDVFFINVDGTNMKRLTNSPARDWYSKWSPDGNKIAFVRLEGGNDKIYVMDADGKSQTLISNPVDGVSDWNLGWSPDGEKIVFNKHFSIYIMDADGSNERFLTKGWLPIWTPPVGKDTPRTTQ